MPWKRCFQHTGALKCVRFKSWELLSDPEIFELKWRNVIESFNYWTLLMQSVSWCNWEQPVASVSDKSAAVPLLCLQGVEYVTVSVIALCFGCQEKKRQIGLPRSLHVVDWIAAFAASTLNCNFMLITTSSLKRKESRGIHCFAPHKVVISTVRGSQIGTEHVALCQNQEFVTEQACNNITFQCWKLVIAMKLSY